MQEAHHNAPLRLLVRAWPVFAGIMLVIGVLFLATSDHPRIFPLRHIVLYQVEAWWYERVGAPQQRGTGTLQGCVSTADGRPAVAATVLVAELEGTTHSTTTDTAGCYILPDLPAGSYVPVVGATNGVDISVRPAVRVQPDQQQTRDIRLPPPTLPAVEPGRDLRLGAPITLAWPLPRPGSAVEQSVQFDSGGQPNQTMFYYTPVDAAAPLPVLLIVYPGPAEAWKGVSIPLAAAGYAVVATGPAYSFDLEADLDELQRVIQFVRAGAFPYADGRQLVLMGGSYSSLHVLAMLQRDVSFEGAVLLGPPTDLFALRRQLEAGTFAPPFGLDQALIALGRPNTNPEPFWRYSARYHVRPDWPPLLLMHSRSDEVVPFEQSELLAAELEAAGLPYEATFFDGMSHYLLADDASEQLDMLYTILLEFLASVFNEPAP
ncbi:MAG: prolyl oligopeptidase family serine peptidase [Chloroflexaceae bacterium]|nr:prolyl oligopeptidase family serine peptidase [Chloroflexaceae bacterium]